MLIVHFKHAPANTPPLPQNSRIEIKKRKKGEKAEKTKYKTI